MRNDGDSTLWLDFHDDAGNPMPVVIDEVISDTVFVRHPDPGDVPLGRVPLEPGQSAVMTTPIDGVGLCASGEVGADDEMFSLRVVPEGRADGVVFGRTLRHGELDDGRRVHVRPGESFSLAPGAVAVALAAIDDYYRQVDSSRPEGCLATALRVWFGIGSHDEASEMRMLTVAAAHRLDAAEHLLRRAAHVRYSMKDEDDLRAAQLVAKVDELIHLVQEGIVATARCIALVERGTEAAVFAFRLPSAVLLHKAAIKDLRDAYEHIEERAFGRVGIRGVSDERALMIFDHEPLVRSGVIEYMDHHLDLDVLPDVLDGCRLAIRALAGGPPEPSS